MMHSPCIAALRSLIKHGVLVYRDRPPWYTLLEEHNQCIRKFLPHVAHDVALLASVPLPPGLVLCAVPERLF
jgi:hypothetical protein